MKQEMKLESLQPFAHDFWFETSWFTARSSDVLTGRQYESKNKLGARCVANHLMSCLRMCFSTLDSGRRWKKLSWRGDRGGIARGCKLGRKIFLKTFLKDLTITQSREACVSRR
ncbi:hypothetical protein OCU04_004933 [Sclerotinia nivalis]|uniref:Uncharacterized protein n=1 Tax=Sclerotinia nivalis TaxID=352851 RepID=A0A9X0ARF8_9HELO|nr:hypothetical protein OCU04_004933 [Sclerotinia nivalis]